MRTHSRWLSITAAIVVGCCVLSFYRTTDGAQRSGSQQKPPFANAVDQRFETIKELKGIRTLLQEQNALLKEQIKLLQQIAPNEATAKKR